MRPIPGEVVLFDEKYHFPELNLVLFHEGISTHLEGDKCYESREQKSIHRTDL
jgi:hypothetical protein